MTATDVVVGGRQAVPTTAGLEHMHVCSTQVGTTYYEGSKLGIAAHAAAALFSRWRRLLWLDLLSPMLVADELTSERYLPSVPAQIWKRCGPQSRRRYGSGVGPCPGADVAAVSLVPAQMWQRRA